MDPIKPSQIISAPTCHSLTIHPTSPLSHPHLGIRNEWSQLNWSKPLLGLGSMIIHRGPLGEWVRCYPQPLATHSEGSLTPRICLIHLTQLLTLRRRHPSRRTWRREWRDSRIVHWSTITQEREWEYCPHFSLKGSPNLDNNLKWILPSSTATRTLTLVLLTIITLIRISQSARESTQIELNINLCREGLERRRGWIKQGGIINYLDLQIMWNITLKVISQVFCRKESRRPLLYLMDIIIHLGLRRSVR